MLIYQHSICGYIMGLKDKWKNTGKNTGTAFGNFGKALGKTMKTVFTDEENKVE